MMSTHSIQQCYTQDLQWLTQYVQIRCKQIYTLAQTSCSVINPAKTEGIYEELLAPFTYDERLIVVMALANTIYPQLWEIFTDAITTYHLEEHDTASFGLVQTKGSQYFQATISTALFLLGGPKAEDQKSAWQWFLPHLSLRRQGVLDLPTPETFPPLHTILKLTPSYQYQLVTEQAWQPQYGTLFPATLLTTSKTWDDLVVDEKTEMLIDQARKWVSHYDKIREQPAMAGTKGYRLLMSGPSGTGKTMTAALLGREANKPVYRIDISNIVDKYVGETSKKLRRIFEVAEAQDWILFFDEGDALFGKRSNGAGNSNERYANQEVAYLLYKLEEYQGMIFLATNHKSAIDIAFERRFDSLIAFHKPDEYTRRRLWQHFFGQSNTLALDPGIGQGNWRELAEAASVSAAWIEKFYQYCVMQTTAKNDGYISAEDMRRYLHWFGTERGHFEHKTGNLFQKQYYH